MVALKELSTLRHIIFIEILVESAANLVRIMLLAQQKPTICELQYQITEKFDVYMGKLELDSR